MSVFITATTDPCMENELTSYIKQLSDIGIDYIHFDVMDGVFVPNKKLDTQTIQAEMQKNPQIQTVIHLMTDNPLPTIEEYIKCKAKYLVVHYEAFRNEADLIKCLKLINKSTTISGIALKPETPLSVLSKDILSNVGLIMVMGVIPGKSGQTMLDGTIDKVKALSQIATGKFVACDGGINEGNISKVIEAGTDFVSLGSYMYKLVKEGSAKRFIEQF